MASQVLSGNSNPSYTNTTGQNVRVVINYMLNVTAMTWAGVTFSAGISENVVGKGIYIPINGPGLKYQKEGGMYPVDIALTTNQSFSATCGPYNILVIKEDGT